MKFLVPMYYFMSGSIQSNSALYSQFEYSGSFITQKPTPVSGTVGLWEYDGIGLMPAAGTQPFDNFWEYDGLGNVIPRDNILIESTYNNLSISMSVASSSTYEPRKAFTSDLGEYGKIKDLIILTYPYTSVGTQGLLIKSDTVLNDTGKQIVLMNSLTLNRGDYTSITPTSVYGNASISGDSLINNNNPTDVLVLGEYPNDSTWRYYAVYLSGSSDYENIHSMTHGILYDIGSGHRLEEQSFDYDFPQFNIRYSLLGKTRWNGWKNTKNQRSHNLQLRGISKEMKDVILNIFTLGKGGLPIWFIDDESDSNTWMYVYIPTMNLTEPNDRMYNITLQLMEF